MTLLFMLIVRSSVRKLLYIIFDVHIGGIFIELELS